MKRWIRNKRHVESGPPEFATPTNHGLRVYIIGFILNRLPMWSGQPDGGLARWKKRANSSREIGRGRMKKNDLKIRQSRALASHHHPSHSWASHPSSATLLVSQKSLLMSPLSSAHSPVSLLSISFSHHGFVLVGSPLPMAPRVELQRTTGSTSQFFFFLVFF